MMPAIGVRPPVLTLVVVRAMAPVAAKAAEERGGDIGQPLGDQFLIGVVAVINLAVGNASREQRFDGAEQGNGDRRRDQLAKIVDRQAGEADIGQFLRDAVEAAADGFDRQIESEGNQRAEHAVQPVVPGARRMTGKTCCARRL